MYHYTRLDILENIIKSNFWRFSALENANDKRERYTQLNDSLFNKCYYICTTGCNTNPALWQHYAYEHKGVCIELELPDDCFSFKEIEYDGKYFNLNKRDFSIDDAITFLSHKSKYWNYEEEIRAFYTKTPTVDPEGCFGIENALSLIKSVIVGNGVDYENLPQITIDFFNKFKIDNKLFIISWHEGIGTVIENKSPKLLSN